MIIQDRAANNRQGHFFMPGLVLLFALTLLLSGCGQDSEIPPESTDSSTSASEIQCGVQIDETAWKVFQEITKQHQSGQAVTRTDFQDFADLPILSPWKESMSDHLSSVRIVNWLDETYNPLESKDAKRTADRRQFSSSYHYSIKNMDDIETLITQFATGDYRCQLREKINFWISADVSPDTLVVAFLPSKPEIRVFHQYLFVDTGVLKAGNFDQLSNQLTGILFRARMQLFGDVPTGCQGQDAVTNSIRVMMNEGIIGYIEDQPNTFFSPDHPKLGDFNIVPEYVFQHGIKAIELFNFHLKTMLADEEIMLKRGKDLAKTFVASSSLNQGGFSMSSTIAANLGEDVLRGTAGSPTAWLAAYQKAAKMNPVPAPPPFEVTDEMHKSMPPFEDEIFEGLMNILEQKFSTP